MLIRNTIKKNGTDINLKIPLSGSDEFVGYQQEIDSFTQIQTTNSVNDVVDGEISRYKIVDGSRSIVFYFYNIGSLHSDYTDAGFTVNEIESGNENFLNSYYILDFYDTYSSSTQTKIFSTYITNLGNNTNTGYSFSNKLQIKYLSVPRYVISSSETTIYMKVSFYNAKTGRLSLFYNGDNRDLISSEKAYFKVVLDNSNNEYNFDTDSNTGTSPKVIAYEFNPLTNEKYVDKNNNTIDNYDNLKEIFPEGSVFDYETGKYFTE